MMRSALGQAASLTDYDVVKKRLLASDYTMNFTNGVTFDLNVKTSDTVTAATLVGADEGGSAIPQDERQLRREKMALENTTVTAPTICCKCTSRPTISAFRRC